MNALTGIDLFGFPGETKWPNLKHKHEPKILLEENFSLITQPGDRLHLPETVRMIPGLLEAPGKTLAQGKEMEGSLDLLLLLLWESVDLRQQDTREEILLRRWRLSCYGVSWVMWQTEHRPLSSKCRNTRVFSWFFYSVRSSHEDTDHGKGVLGSLGSPGTFLLLLLFGLLFHTAALCLCHRLVTGRKVEKATITSEGQLYWTNAKEWKNTLLSDLRVRVSHWVSALSSSEGSTTRWWFFSSYLCKQGGEEGDRLDSCHGPAQPINNFEQY